MKMMSSIAICILFIFLFVEYQASYDVDEKELAFLAHHLNIKECRQLIESLHENSMFISEDASSIPDGSHLPQNMSCIELLEQWDKKESRKESFVRMAQRLRDLGHIEMAKIFSRTIFKDKENILEVMVFDQMTTKSSNIEKEEVIYINNPEGGKKDAREVHIKDFDGREENSGETNILPDWKLSQKILFIVSIVFTFGLFGFWFFHCIPDCFRSLREICRRKTVVTDDATHLLLNEMEYQGL